MRRGQKRARVDEKYVENRSRVEGDQPVGCGGALQTATPEQRKILTLRVVLAVSLFASACVCGAVSYYQLRQKEIYQFESEYSSLSAYALNVVNFNFVSMAEDMGVVSEFVAAANPNPDSWPNVILPGFHAAMSVLSPNSSVGVYGFMPIVQ
ncbi:hypothetical protein B484DRAFT_407984, partial [Ochromonadaceae sp. CCMP2298]